MLTILLVAALAADPCPNGPNYREGVTPCAVADTATPCKCSEFYDLTLAPGIPDEIQIRRGRPEAPGTWELVGTLKKTKEWADEDGVLWPAWIPTRWFFARDTTWAAPDVTWEYCAVACTAGVCQTDRQCVTYRRTAGEYVCFANEKRAPC